MPNPSDQPSRSQLEHAAELLDRLLPQATPAPWRDSTVDSNRYAALVSDTIHPQRNYGGGWEWSQGYGGYLVCESTTQGDRRLLAVMRNVADHLPPLLRAVAQEDPHEAGHAARAIAAALISTHTPRPLPTQQEATR